MALAVATLAVAVVPVPTLAPAPPQARAGLIGSLTGAGCSLLGTFGEGWMGKVCSGAGKVLGVVGKVASNPIVQRGAALAAVVAWVLGGARWTISHIATAISQTTSPALTAGWFTGVYLRIEAIAWLITLPFLAAAGAQAVLSSEPGVLGRVLLYLPLAAVMTGAAVPLTMLLLAVTDALSSGLAHAAGQNGTSFLSGTSAWVVGGLSLADPFVAVTAGAVMVAAGLALWCELIVRELAVYVVVMMLPLVFCAIVWPARRVWAVRTVEVLFALIIAKFAIIVPLAIGAAALAHGGAGNGAGRLVGGLALVLIGCLAPWTLLRLIPLAEIASSAVGHVRGQLHGHAQLPTPETAAARKLASHYRTNGNHAGHDHDVSELLQGMTRRAQQAQPADAATDESPPITDPKRETPTDENVASPHGQRAEASARADDSHVDPGRATGITSHPDPRPQPKTDSPRVEPNVDPSRPPARTGEEDVGVPDRAADPDHTMVQVPASSQEPVAQANRAVPIPEPVVEHTDASESGPPPALPTDPSNPAPGESASRQGGDEPEADDPEGGWE